MQTAPPSFWQLSLILLAMLAAQGLTIYRDAFFIKPIGDDFELVDEIRRGEQDGPLSLYTRSLANNFYRPSKSFVIWWAGRGPEEGRAFRIRLAHFILTAPYLTALALWIRFFRLRWLPAMVGAAVFLLHPGLVATLSSIDGCGGMMASGLIWIGAWSLAVGERQPRLALLCACLCFAFGLTWKEYVFALVPLAAWTTFVFREQRRWTAALQASGVILALFLLHLPLRRWAMPASSDATAAMISHSPAQWLGNAILAGGGLMFLGDTVWLFLNRGLRAYCIAGTAIAAVCGWLAIGLKWAVRTAGIIHAGDRANGKARWQHNSVSRAISFLVLGLGIATFPAILHHKHFAEKYLCPLLLPFALLCAIAFDGWWKSRARAIGITAVLVACVASASADLRKNSDMRAAGLFAETQCLQLLRMFETATGPHRVFLAFLQKDVAKQPKYSIYRFSDDSYVMPPKPFSWWRPETRLSIDSHVVRDLSEIDLSKHELVARWDVDTQRFVRMR